MAADRLGCGIKQMNYASENKKMGLFRLASIFLFSIDG